MKTRGTSSSKARQQWHRGSHGTRWRHRVFLGAGRENSLRTLVADIQRDGIQAEYRRLDVTDLVDFKDCVKAAEDRFGSSKFS